MSRRTCETCEHFSSLASECHRYPPVVLPHPQGVVSAWVPTAPGNWCGEYRPARPPEAEPIEVIRGD